MKKTWKIFGAFAILTALLTAGPAQVLAADEWDDLKGESTVNSKVYTQDGTRLWTTIQTNYHAGGITGLVVQTPAKDIASMLGITDDQAYWGDRPVLYVARASSNAEQLKQMKEYADTLGGKALYDYQINLFRWWYEKSWNEPIETVSKPVKMVAGLNKGEREEGYTFAILCLKNGSGTFLYDQDTDPETLTFEISDFGATYVLVKYPAANTPSAQTGAQNTASGQQAAPEGNDELDEVPKMGDVRTVTLAVICVGSILLGGAAFAARRKMN